MVIMDKNGPILKGYLIKDSAGDWSVKWSDLHSFAHGTHWCFNKVHSKADTHIMYMCDGEIRYKQFEDGMPVKFQLITIYNPMTFSPISTAKIVNKII